MVDTRESAQHVLNALILEENIQKTFEMKDEDYNLYAIYGLNPLDSIEYFEESRDNEISLALGEVIHVDEAIKISGTYDMYQDTIDAAAARMISNYARIRTFDDDLKF